MLRCLSEHRRTRSCRHYRPCKRQTDGGGVAEAMKGQACDTDGEGSPPGCQSPATCLPKHLTSTWWPGAACPDGTGTSVFVTKPLARRERAGCLGAVPVTPKLVPPGTGHRPSLLCHLCPENSRGLSGLLGPKTRLW